MDDGLIVSRIDKDKIHRHTHNVKALIPIDHLQLGLASAQNIRARLHHWTMLPVPVHGISGARAQPSLSAVAREPPLFGEHQSRGLISILHAGVSATPRAGDSQFAAQTAVFGTDSNSADGSGPTIRCPAIITIPIHIPPSSSNLNAHAAVAPHAA